MASLREGSAQLRHTAEQKMQIIIENAERESGDSEGVERDDLVAVYDQRQVSDRGADNIKWYNPYTELGDTSGSERRTKKRGICFHHTAVAGGFGTRSDRRDFWREQGINWAPEVPQPNGESVIQPGERVLLYAMPAAIGRLEKLFVGKE